MYWCSQRIKFQEGKQRELLYRVREKIGTFQKLRLFLKSRDIKVSYATLKTWVQEVYSLPAEVVGLLTQARYIDRERVEEWKLREYNLNRRLGLAGASNQPLTMNEKIVLSQNQENMPGNLTMRLHYTHRQLMRNFDFAYFYKSGLIALEEVGSINMVNSRKTSFKSTMEVYYKQNKNEGSNHTPLLFTVNERRKYPCYERHVAYDSLLHLLDNGIPIVTLAKRVEILQATEFFQKMARYPLKKIRNYITRIIKNRRKRSIANARIELKRPKTEQEKTVEKALSKYVKTQGKKLILNQYGLPFVTDNSFKINDTTYCVFVDTDPLKCLGSCFGFQETVKEENCLPIGIYLHQRNRLCYEARKIARHYFITHITDLPKLIALLPRRKAPR